MSSNSIVKSVAKELKYYCDVKRLEDGFDLTGLHGGNNRDVDGQIYKMQFPSLQYEDSEDDYLTHYYDCYDTETPIVNMSGVSAYDTHGPREEKVKRKIKKHMTNYHFLLTDPSLPHVSKKTKSAKSKHKKGPKLPEYYYIYTAKPQLLPRATTCVGTRPSKSRSSKTRSLSRSTTKSDTNRLVNAAAKLLVATETVESLDSARSPRPQTAPRSFEENQRPHTAKYSYDINGRKVFNTQLKYYDGNSSASDYGVRRTQSSRSPVRRPSSPTPSNTSDDTHSSSISIDDVNRLKTPAPPKSSKNIRNRTYINDGKKTDQEEVAVSVSMQTEFNDSVGIQTERRLLEKYDHTEDEVKEGPIGEYEIIVITGTVNGASTKADVRITLYGEHGRTKEITLEESKTHKLKFQKGKEDRFNISAHHVGEIQKIKIGHDRPELSYAWYLECVTVSDIYGKKVYDFTCNRWLTGQNGDKNTYVYLSVERDRNLVENGPITPYESTVPREKPKSDSVFKAPRTQGRPPSSQKQRQQKQRIKSSTSASSVEVVTPEKKRTKPVKQVQQRKIQESSGSESTYTSDSYTNTTKSETETEPEEESREETIISLKGSPRRQNKANQRKVSNDSSNKANGPTFTFLSKDSEKRGQTEKMKSENKRRESEKRNSDREEKKEEKKKERSKSSKSRNDSEEDKESKVDFLKGYKAGLEAAEKDSIRQREDRMEEDKRILTHGMTIHEAASNGHIERIKQLVDRFPELKESKDEKGLLPLHKSVIHGQTLVTKWLAATGVDLNQETPQSYTPMHLAALHGHVNIMMILAAMGAEVNCETIEKQTPLHLAARGGHLECVKWLVANRSVLTAEDSFGRKPVYLAEEFEKQSVADFLRACERELGNPESGFAKMFNGSSSNMDKDSASYKADVGSEDEASTVNGGDSSTTTGSDIRKVQNMKERRKSYDTQHAKMEERGKSFLDSIRQDVEEDDE